MTGLWMIFGNLRSGKTAFLAWLAHQHKLSGIKVFSNFNMTFSDWVAPAEIIMMRDPTDCLIAIDELWAMIDSRQSTTGENEFLDKIILGSGKDGVTIAGTSQMPHMVDKRFRDIADYKVLCERKGRTKDRNATIKAHIGIHDFRAHRGLALSTKRFKVHEVCDLYDTTEKIERNKRVFIREMARVLQQDDQELMHDLRSAESVTEQRELLYAYAGIKRSHQIPLLKELRLR